LSDAIPLDFRHIKISDLKRARAGPLEGRDPMELLDDRLERMTLIIWCHRSRHDPEFTWADAEQVEIGTFEEWNRPDVLDDEEDGEQPADPPAASPGEPSARPTSDDKPSSTAKPPKRALSGSSGSSSASPKTATTP
jgi:hypothetical protein